MITWHGLDEAGGLAAIPFFPDALETESRGFWLDAINPDAGELKSLGAALRIDIPDRQDMAEIELSNRLYKDGDSLVMIASLIPKAEEGRLPPTRPATFIFRDDLLITVRFCDFFSFERMVAEMAKNRQINSATAVFFGLLEEMVSDRADGLERSMRRLEELTAKLFLPSPEVKTVSPGGDDLAAVIKGIGALGVEVSIIRESIASLQRMLNFAKAHLPVERRSGMAGVMDSLKNDLTALADEASFLMNKLSFNLDAALGMINLDETKVIRLLSVVTLILSPPLLIAGIYGMNFRHMPELGWEYGYLASLALMLFTAVASIRYLRWRRWL
ncbi:MAG: hypothetical protein LBU64_09285 [Planctomycetota bacterium]|jgi:magnesium transporter|nr:hypothetical protein [Planctomycetota bacterium]